MPKKRPSEPSTKAVEEHNLPIDRSVEDSDGATLDVEELGSRYLEDATESRHQRPEPDRVPRDEPVDEVLEDLVEDQQEDVIPGRRRP